MTAPVRSRSVLPSIRWWHKWIGILVGLLLVGWVASGVVAVLPESSAAEGPRRADPSLDLARVVITPAQAVEAVAKGLDKPTPPSPPRSITLQRLLDTAVYSVMPMSGHPVLVNATNGEIFKITPERAVAIAADVATGLKVKSVERILSRPGWYYGRLPAQLITYGDAAQTMVIVSEGTGEAARTTRRDRMSAAIFRNFHVFDPLARLPGGQKTRKGTLIVTGIIGLLSIFSGYWLSIPRRWLRRSA